MTNRGPAERFKVREGTGATLEYESCATRVPVRLVDFSTTGLGLLMPEPPRVGAAVILSLMDGVQTSKFGALIRWAEPRTDGLWRAGCQFSQGIGCTFSFSTEVMRAPCNLPVAIRYQGDPQNQHEAIVVDHSDGGLGLRSEHAPTPGSNLLIEPGDGHAAFVVRVQWCLSETGESFAGCQFTRRSDLLAFRRLLPAQPLPDPPPTVARRSTRGTWLGCAFVYMWSALYAFGFWPPL